MARKLNWMISSGICMFIAAAAIALPSALASAQASGQGSSQASGQTPIQQPAVRIPSFNPGPPAKPLADTLSPAEFTDPLTKMAAKVKNVLYQQPCFCYCDQNDGHHSLYDCFVTAHASGCNICRYEAIFAYEETRKGVTAAQIRKEIIRGDWRKIDPNAYSTPKDIR
jgi:hypothetical protein